MSYTSSSSAAINKRRRLPATSVINSLWSATAKGIALGDHSTRCRQILAQNRDFCLPHLHSTTPLGGVEVPSEYYHDVWHRKTRIVWLPDGEKIEDMFIRFDRIHERDRRTDRRRDTALRHRPRLHSIARQKSKRIAGYCQLTNGAKVYIYTITWTVRFLLPLPTRRRL